MGFFFCLQCFNCALVKGSNIKESSDLDELHYMLYCKQEKMLAEALLLILTAM